MTVEKGSDSPETPSVSTLLSPSKVRNGRQETLIPTSTVTTRPSEKGGDGNGETCGRRETQTRKRNVVEGRRGKQRTGRTTRQREDRRGPQGEKSRWHTRRDPQEVGPDGEKDGSGDRFTGVHTDQCETSGGARETSLWVAALGVVTPHAPEGPRVPAGPGPRVGKGSGGAESPAARRSPEVTGVPGSGEDPTESRVVVTLGVPPLSGPLRPKTSQF